MIQLLKQRNLEAINNYNKILKSAKNILADKNIFTAEQLASFALNSVGLFNEIPPFSNYTVENTEFIETHLQLLAEHTALVAKACINMIEHGREFRPVAICGLIRTAFVSPTTSEILQTKYAVELDNWLNKAFKQKQVELEPRV